MNPITKAIEYMLKLLGKIFTMPEPVPTRLPKDIKKAAKAYGMTELEILNRVRKIHRDAYRKEVKLSKDSLRERLRSGML